jgi:hypothetical protein
MVGQPWPADRNSEVVISNLNTSRVEKRLVSSKPKTLARKIVKVAASRGWVVKGRGPFREVRDDVGAYTYRLERVDPVTGEVVKKDIDVYFPISPRAVPGRADVGIEGGGRRGAGRMPARKRRGLHFSPADLTA